MKTIHGIARNQGIAIAVAAVVDTVRGINGVSQAILQEGITAIRKQLEIRDYPEVIVACDDLTTGLAVKIPGIRTIGIAAQSEVDLPGLEIDLPCVVGLNDLLAAITEGDILIVDGNKGVVYVDPDPPTLIHYQQLEAHHEARSKVFISSEHIPAKTQRGETVNVFACAVGGTDVEQALGAGADALFIDLSEEGEDTHSFYERVYKEAAGKPVWFVSDYLPAELARAAAKFALPDQTTVLLHAEDHESLLQEAETVIENVGVEAFLNDLDPPKLRMGLFAGAGDTPTDDESPLVLDLRESAYLGENIENVGELLESWTGQRPGEDILVLIGNHIDSIPKLVEAGAKSIAVTPDKISEAKYSIRSTGADE